MAHEPCWPATCQTESHRPHDRHTTDFGKPCRSATLSQSQLFSSTPYAPPAAPLQRSLLYCTVLLRRLSRRQLKGVAGAQRRKGLCGHVWGPGGRPPLHPPSLSPLQPTCSLLRFPCSLLRLLECQARIRRFRRRSVELGCRRTTIALPKARVALVPASCSACHAADVVAWACGGLLSATGVVTTINGRRLDSGLRQLRRRRMRRRRLNIKSSKS